MGSWLMQQAAMSLKVNIETVWPERGTIGADFNRTFIHLGDEEENPNLQKIYIMWTPMIIGGWPNHFVPLLKIHNTI